MSTMATDEPTTTGPRSPTDRSRHAQRDGSPHAQRDDCVVVDWARCLAEHEGWLRGVILVRTGEAQAVDEVWQELSLAAVEQRAPLAEPAKAPAWLYRVAVVRSIRYRRQQARRRKRLMRFAAESNGHASQADDPAGWLLLEESRQLVREALGRLAGRDAEILLLKYHERWSYRQIAKVLGISESAADARVFRARERLRRELASHFPGENHR
jgi:RNA polymerase sigma factor (sigma-70 family)